MKKTPSGHLIIIVAPSGAGKSTLIKMLHQDFPKLQESISCTTRAPRTGEMEGVNYFFINDIHLYYYVQCGPEVMTLNEGAAVVVGQIEKLISPIE